MDAVTITFIAIGCFALVLLALSLVGGHLHVGHLHVPHLRLPHLHFGSLHLGHPAANSANAAGGQGIGLTLPAIAGFLGTFGFVGAIVAALSGPDATAEALLAAGAGLVAGVPAAWSANRLMDAAMRMPTDATPTSADLVGATGVVISDVPPGGLGEVRLTIAGQPMKFNARADQPLARGASVFVIEVSSPTCVLVEPTPGALTAPPAKEGQ